MVIAMKRSIPYIFLEKKSWKVPSNNSGNYFQELFLSEILRVKLLTNHIIPSNLTLDLELISRVSVLILDLYLGCPRETWKMIKGSLLNVKQYQKDQIKSPPSFPLLEVLLRVYCLFVRICHPYCQGFLIHWILRMVISYQHSNKP